MLVYGSENPHASKNAAKSSLPVIWKSHRKTWISRQVFHDWFVDNSVPEIRLFSKCF
jgi:hypothetical protein